MSSPQKTPTSAKIQRRIRNSKHKRGTSEVGRFFSNLLKPEDETKTRSKKKRTHFHSMRVPSPLRELDAEALTAEERLSRLLHTPKPRIKLPDSGTLYDHFVVVGLPSTSSTEPKILFQYPAESSVGIPGLEDFCFPDGVHNEVLEDTEENSDLITLMHSQDHLKHPENLFVFLFTDQESQVYYGICVHKRELLGDPPQYVKDIFTSPTAPVITTRCYCLITRFPFFRFHFDFVFSLFAIDHVSWLETQAPSILNEQDEISVFLSGTPSRKKQTGKRQTENTDDNAQNSGSADRSSEDGSFILHKSKANQAGTPVVSRLRRRCKSAEEGTADLPLRCSAPDIVVGKVNNEKPVPRISIDLEDSDESPRSYDESPCIKAMSMYQQIIIPEKGERSEFQPSPYLSPISFTRPYVDEEEELFAEWGLALTFHMISFDTLCEFISAILLEKKVLVYANDLRVLSALVFSFPPLIRPFTYQSVIIPMLPAKMESFLEAPVPFVVGAVSLPTDIPDDVVVVDVTQDEVRSPEVIADLPNLDDLRRKTSSLVEDLENSFGGEIPYETTVVQRQLINSICTMFVTHFDSVFASFHNYTICNMSDPLTPISVFMKDSFLDDIEESELPFIEPFISSQAFFEFSDNRLRLRDSDNK